MLDAVDVVRAQRDRRSNCGDVRSAPRQLFEEHADLQSREPVAQAEVRAATTECKVIVWIASDVKPERVLEHRLVAIAGEVPKRHRLALGDLLTADLGVGQCRAPKVLNRGCPTQDL